MIHVKLNVTTTKMIYETKTKLAIKMITPRINDDFHN